MAHHLLQMMVLLLQKEVELEDPFENMGAQLVKEVATKQMTWQEMAQQQLPYWHRL